MKPTQTKVERKTFAFELKSLDETTGAFTGYAAAYSRDSYDDIIDSGAFKRTCDHWAQKALSSSRRLPVLWQHDPSMPIGADDGEMFEDVNGLNVKGRLCLEVQQGREARALAGAGVLGLSIGFRTIKADTAADGTRHLKEIQLLEYSFVTFPANQDAVITGVKSAAGAREGKTMDFNQTLANQTARHNLAQQRWDLMDALHSALCAALDLEDLDDGGQDEGDEPAEPADSAALAQTGAIIDQFKAAYLNWAAAWLALDAQKRADVAAEIKASQNPIQAKAGRTVSTATMDIVKQAADAHAQCGEHIKALLSLGATETDSGDGPSDSKAHGTGLDPATDSPEDVTRLLTEMRARVLIDEMRGTARL